MKAHKGYNRESLRKMVKKYNDILNDLYNVWNPFNFNRIFGLIRKCPICHYRATLSDGVGLPMSSVESVTRCKARMYIVRSIYSTIVCIKIVNDCPAVVSGVTCTEQDWYEDLLSAWEFDVDLESVKQVLEERRDFWKKKLKELYPKG